MYKLQCQDGFKCRLVVQCTLLYRQSVVVAIYSYVSFCFVSEGSMPMNVFRINVNELNFVSEKD